MSIRHSNQTQEARAQHSQDDSSSRFSRFITSMVFILLNRQPSSIAFVNNAKSFRSNNGQLKRNPVSITDMGWEVDRFAPQILHCIHQILRCTARSIPLSSIILALKYISRIATYRIKIPSVGAEAHLFCVCLILAHKTLDDHAFKNKTWSKITRMPTTMICQMERECLASLKFDLFVGKEEFESWQRGIQKEARVWNAALTTVSPPSPNLHLPSMSHQTPESSLALAPYPSPPPPVQQQHHSSISPLPNTHTTKKARSLV